MRCAVLLLFLLVGPVAADASGLFWGMTARDLLALPDPPSPVQPARRWGGGLSAPLHDPGAEVGGLGFTAWFQMRAGRLVQVLYDRRAPLSPAEFAGLVERIGHDHGPPGRICKRTGPAAAVEAVWTRPEGILHAVFLDFSVPETAIGRQPQPLRADPPAGPAPGSLLPRQDKQRRERLLPPDPIPPPRLSALPEARTAPGVRPVPAPQPLARELAGGSSPRRILLRWHDPAAPGLASVTCPD